MSVFTNPASRSADQAQAYTTAVLELLGNRNPIEVLRGTVPSLKRVTARLSPEQMTQPEAEGKWSARHLLQHLADSELVWGYRLRMVLAHDRPPLTGYDQDLWASRLHYDEANAADALRDFDVLRQANLRLLERLSEKDLERVGLHQERGQESVRRMMQLYAGHDLLHLRQLERIRETIGAPR